MSDVFNQQKLLTIKLDCNNSLADATDMQIIYKKPDGSTGSWDATQDANTTMIMVSCSDGKIDQAGTWEFQAYYLE